MKGLGAEARERRASCVAALCCASAAVFLSAWAPSGVASAAGGCTAWAGEVSPLPSTEARDPFLARWAQMRADELSTVAAAVASTDPAAAHRLWSHALCLAPENSGVQRQLAQLAPRSESMATPVVVREKPAPEQRPRIEFTEVDQTLATAATALTQARFREALEAVARARTQLAAMSSIPAVLSRRARLEVMAGTAELALGQEPQAKLSLRRALDSDPDLKLDDSTPPKVRRLFESVRGAREARSR